MKIGIFTYHRSHNYGAFMQAYSLSSKLGSIAGIQCEIVNYNLKKEDAVYWSRIWKRPLYAFDYLRQDRAFQRAQSRLPLSGSLLLSDSLSDIQEQVKNKYDCLIAGSDEIWQIGSRGFPNAYWLPGELGAVKMSYAASSRMRYDSLAPEVREQMRELYRDFAYIGARDEITRRQVGALCPEKTVHRNCDPGFLYDGYLPKHEIREWLRKKYGVPANKKLVGVMHVRPWIIKKLREKFGRDCYFICLYRPMYNADLNLSALDPFEWVNAIGGMDFFVTAFFHGTVFALTQDVPFAAIDHRASASNADTSKIHDLLGYENLLQSYYSYSGMDGAEWNRLYADMSGMLFEGGAADYSAVRERQRSLFEPFADALASI